MPGKVLPTELRVVGVLGVETGIRKSQTGRGAGPGQSRRVGMVRLARDGTRTPQGAGPQRLRYAEGGGSDRPGGGARTVQGAGPKDLGEGGVRGWWGWSEQPGGGARMAWGGATEVWVCGGAVRPAQGRGQDAKGAGPWLLTWEA